MPITKAVVTLQHVSGVPADAVQNTFYFETAAGTDADLFDAIKMFYNDLAGAPAVGAVGAYISRAISRGANQSLIELTTMPAVKPVPPAGLGSPRASHSFTLVGTDNAATSLPSEMAVALSFQADQEGVVEESGTTRPRARRRGRIFIGPVNSNTLTLAAGTTGEQRVALGCRESVTASARDHLGSVAMLDGWEWKVFSQTAWTSAPVVTAWVDDAFDVQRRRGPAPSVRTSVLINGGP